MVKIVTDSLCDISAEMAKELDVSVVPVNVHFGTETYLDQVDITTAQFYDKLAKGSVHPTSSAPPTGTFVNLFTKLSKETNEILAVMVSSKLSATYESALQAKALVKADCRIEVIDTLQIVGAQLLLVIMAARAAKNGANLDQMSDMVKKGMTRCHARMAFDTLEYLKRGGRIGKGQAFLGGLLKVNPVLGLKDGEVVPIARARNRTQATDMLVNFVKGFPKIEGLVVEDATTPDERDALAKRLSEFVPSEITYKSKVSPVIGVHVGPHVLAVSVMEGV